MDKKRLIYIIIGPVLFALSSFTLGGALTQPGAMAFGTLLWMVFWWVTRPVHMTVTALLPGIVNAIFAMVPMGSNVIYLRKILLKKQIFPFSTSNSNFYSFFII